MSTSATEFYGYLLSSGYDGEQLSAFEILCDEVNKGKISMNQAFKKAKKIGYTNASGTANAPSSLQEWIQTAKEAGWIDKGVEALNTAIQQKVGDDWSIQYGRTTPPIVEPPKNNTGKWIALIVGVAVVGGLIYHFSKNKE
jgi:hypothetical protein